MKKNIFKAAFMIVVIAFTTQISFSQTAKRSPKKKLVDSLVTATFEAFPVDVIETTLGKMLEYGSEGIKKEMGNLIIQKLDETDLSEAKKNEVRQKIPALTDQLAERFRAIMMENLDMKQWVKDSLAANYNKQFTIAELRQLNAFYASPSGKEFSLLVKEIASAEMEKRPAQTDGIVSKKSEAQIESFMKTPVAIKFIAKFTDDPDGILEKRIDEWGEKMVKQVEEEMESGELNRILTDFIRENFG